MRSPFWWATIRSGAGATLGLSLVFVFTHLDLNKLMMVAPANIIAYGSAFFTFTPYIVVFFFLRK
jgi:hypothetical protein